MKKDAIILNTLRLGTILEKDIYAIMNLSHLNSATVDVFEKETYTDRQKKKIA